MCVKCVDRGARRGWYEVERCAVVACRSPPTYIRRGAWACLVASIHSMIAVYVSLEEAVCNWGMYTDTTTRSGPMCGGLFLVCGLFLVLYVTRTSNPVGCNECAGERYVDIVGVTVRKYAYGYE